MPSLWRTSGKKLSIVFNIKTAIFLIFLLQYTQHTGQGMRKCALGCSRIFLGLASKINYREKAENLEIVEAWDFPNASKSGDVGA